MDEIKLGSWYLGLIQDPLDGQRITSPSHTQHYPSRYQVGQCAFEFPGAGQDQRFWILCQAYRSTQQACYHGRHTLLGNDIYICGH